jgi:hypothetical protein
MFIVMLNVIMLGVVILNVVAPRPEGANLTKLFPSSLALCQNKLECLP